MHDLAVLKSAHALLGPLGKVISISEVEKHFASSQLANTASFLCADSACGVKVTAVIVKPKKMGRKKSPSSYFKARGGHGAGCSRTANPASTYHAPAPVQPASPVKAPYPTRWIDPTVAAPSSSGGIPAANANPGTGSSSRSGRSHSGTGQSQSSSQSTERYARSWMGMNSSERTQTPLIAPWNPAGTYHSAFEQLQTGSCNVLTPGTKRFFVGTIKSAKKFKTGYVISLHEQTSAKQNIEIWIKNAALSPGSLAGQQLATELKALESQKYPIAGRMVVALGEFDDHWISATKLVKSMPIEHYALTWISP